MIGPPGPEPAANMDEFSAHKVETAIKLDARRTAVLVVDMLNDFCKPGGAMVLPGYERLIAPQRAVISAARQTDAPVVFIADSHRPNVRRDREFLKRTPHCVEGSWGAQVIDDLTGRTLASASSVDKSTRAALKGGGNIAAAKIVGKAIAERSLAAGIQQVVFDRGGYMYHGRVEALAGAAREAGLKF